MLGWPTWAVLGQPTWPIYPYDSSPLSSRLPTCLCLFLFLSLHLLVSLCLPFFSLYNPCNPPLQDKWFSFQKTRQVIMEFHITNTSISFPSAHGIRAMDSSSLGLTSWCCCCSAFATLLSCHHHHSAAALAVLLSLSYCQHSSAALAAIGSLPAALDEDGGLWSPGHHQRAAVSPGCCPRQLLQPLLPPFFCHHHLPLLIASVATVSASSASTDISSSQKLSTGAPVLPPGK